MKAMIKSAVMAAAILGSACPAGAERPAIDLNMYNEIKINRPASKIWPYLMEPNQWKSDRHMIHHHGPKGQVGEVLAIVPAGKPDQIWFFAEVLELVPNKRRTVKMISKTGQLLGYTIWRLEERSGRTMVYSDVHGEATVPSDDPAKITPEALAEQRRQGYESNKTRTDAELLKLKRMVESSK